MTVTTSRPWLRLSLVAFALAPSACGERGDGVRQPDVELRTGTVAINSWVYKAAPPRGVPSKVPSRRPKLSARWFA
jgi:hypothetical protein